MIWQGAGLSTAATDAFQQARSVAAVDNPNLKSKRFKIRMAVCISFFAKWPSLPAN